MHALKGMEVGMVRDIVCATELRLCGRVETNRIQEVIHGKL
jgi:hypothetical protein